MSCCRHFTDRSRTSYSYNDVTNGVIGWHQGVTRLVLETRLLFETRLVLEVLWYSRNYRVPAVIGFIVWLAVT